MANCKGLHWGSGRYRRQVNIDLLASLHSVVDVHVVLLISDAVSLVSSTPLAPPIRFLFLFFFLLCLFFSLRLRLSSSTVLLCWTV